MNRSEEPVTREDGIVVLERAKGIHRVGPKIDLDKPVACAPLTA
jgi:hypothetical protein